VDAGHDDDNEEENDNEDDISIREDSDAITGNGYSLRSHTDNTDITGDSMDGEVHSWGHGQESGYVFPLDEGKDNLDTVEQLCIDKSGSCGTNIYATPSLFILFIVAMKLDLCESGMLVDTAAREVTTAMAVENWRNSIHSSSRLDEDLGSYDLQDNGHAMGPDHEEYTMSTSQGSGQSSDSEDEEEQLPVLTLQVADPEGSCFDELLYWVSWDGSGLFFSTHASVLKQLQSGVFLLFCSVHLSVFICSKVLVSSTKNMVLINSFTLFPPLFLPLLFCGFPFLPPPLHPPVFILFTTAQLNTTR
jgi:hypothetical protein